jgi:hypothetical protein
MDSERIQRAAIALMARDHADDVRRLDSILGRGESATLSPLVPPNPFVGDPTRLIPGECVALIGINPKLDLDRKGFQQFEIDIPTACQASYARSGDAEAFSPWFEKLHNYYDSDAYYGRYFTRLGNHIGSAWFTSPGEGEPANVNARRVLRDHVLKLDAILYYSTSDEMDPERVIKAMHGDEALGAHRKLMEAMFEECRPRHLQVNGKTTAGSMMKALFGERETFENIGRGPSSIEVGWAEIGSHRLPLFIHGFTNVSSGPQSRQAFLECAAQFEAWLD